MRWLRILFSFGVVTSFFGILMCVPTIVSLIYDDGLELFYLSSGGAVFLFGAILALVFKRFKVEIYARHGFLLVSLIWVFLPFLGSIPLLLLLPHLNFSQAYFEAVSGLTASGATVISGLDNLPPSINFWRGEMSWIGGMGLVVLATAVMPILGVGGSSLLQSEIPGPMKENKLTPQLGQMAKALWFVYSGLTLLCALAYYFAGMTVFDAIIHAFTTMSLGGFSSHDRSYAYFDSPLIEGVAIFFMIIAGMNFATHYLALSQRHWRPYINSIEWRSFLFLCIFSVVIVISFLYWKQEYKSFMETVRYGLFNTVSIITTTGYSNTNFGTWPIFAPIFIILMANFTACSGSTGGGMKLIRILVAFNQTSTEYKKLLHRSAYYDNKVGAPLPNRTIISILYFILIYIVSCVILTLLLLITGLDFLTAFSAAIASISNIGPGLGGVGPAYNYSHLLDIQVWICSIAMLFGRLELMALFVVLSPNFWRY